MMLKTGIAVFAAVAVMTVETLAGTSDLSSFEKTFDIVVSDSSVAEGVELADFPALVRLSTAIDGFSYGDFKLSGGADLVFTDGDGVVIPHEIDTWNESGESLVWVKLPALSRGAVIRAYYGNASYVPSSSEDGVWDGFAAVYHLGEASGTAYDSTTNALHATPVGENTGEMLAYDGGAVGKARVNQTGDSSVHNRLEIPNYDHLALGDTFTLSGWFNVSSQDGWNRLVSRKASWGNPGMEVELNATTSGCLDVYGNDGTCLEAAWPSSMKNGWAHLVFVYCGSTVKYYADGVLVAEKNDIVPITDNGKVLALGNNASGDERSFFGRYDEVRLCAGTLPSERIAADHATVNDMDFLKYGAVVENDYVNPADYEKFVKLTVSAGSVAVGTKIAGFPALVRLSSSIEGFNYGDFAAEGGEDLVFADAEGRLLAREIDTWNPEGESLVWVKLPMLATDTEIYAYWGGVDAPECAGEKTWSAFAGVWHMNASGSAVEPDVSGNGRDAVPSSASMDSWGGNPDDTTDQMTTLAGVAGTGRLNQDGYAGYVKNRLLVPSYELGDTFTVSGWFYQKHIYGYHRFITRKESVSEDGWHVEWSYSVEGAGTRLSVFGNGGGGINADIGSIKDRWAYLTFVYAGNSLAVYSDGVLCASGSITPVVDNARPMAIGGSPEGSEPSFEGWYDEVRLAKTALSAERIAADYATVNNADFFTFGAVGASADDPPFMAAPQIGRDELGNFTVTVKMTSGTGTPYVRFVSDGEVPVDVALTEGEVTGPRTYTVVLPSSLPADKTYAIYAVGVNTAGGEVTTACAEKFYNGALSVVRTSDGAEDGPKDGVFTVSRSDAYGDLTVNYTLDGSASAETDYEGTASGSVVIPAGSTSVEVRVTPLVNTDVNDDTQVDFSFTGGFYLPSSATASLKIVNLAPVSRYEFAKRIELTMPMAFLGEDEILENFPVLVRLSTGINAFSYDDFKLAGGKDMMFTDRRGNVLPHEIDVWNPEGESLVWVSVPRLSKGTVVMMYYGNGVNPAGIALTRWPGYAGVWHAGEESGTLRDSTDNSLDAEAVQNYPQGADMSAVADGAIGRGRINQDSTSFYSYDYANYGSDPEVRAKSRRNFMRVGNYDDLAVGGTFTFSGWFRTTGGTEHGEYIACRTAAGNSLGWNVRRCATNSDGEDVRVTVGVADGGADFTIPDMRNNWVHLVVSFDIVENESGERVGEVTLYSNGESAEVYSGTRRGSTYVHDNGLPLTFGNKNDALDGYAYYGQYDELRLKRGTAGASWAKAEYLTVTDDSFVRIGAVQGVKPGLTIIIR